MSSSTSDTRDLAFASVSEQAQQIRQGQLSSEELCRLYLRRIETLDPDLGSYLHVDGNNAIADAKSCDEAIAKGEDPGPLAGVPIALKDLLVTKGMVTTAASKILEGWVPPYEGTAVAKLRQAGAVILGKTNLDEFAMGSSNEHSAFKPCKNPWDLERVPGGSSGGSATAVAAGLCSAALGTDTGGSIRQPAAFTGTVGLKPSYGRVSRYGAIAFASSLDQIGPMTRTVEDAALLFRVIAGVDSHDATSVDLPVPALEDCLCTDDSSSKPLAGLRLGMPKEFFSEGLNSEVKSALEAAAEEYQQLGAELSEISLPGTKFALPTYYLIAPAEASSNLARYDGVRFGKRFGDYGSLEEMYCQTRGHGFGPEVKRRIMLGTYALRSGYYEAYYKKAQAVRTLIKQDFDRAFESVDLILSPTTPTTAFRLGENTSDPVAMYLADIYTLSCNLAAIAGISLPCGFSSNELPIGMQLLSPRFEEARMLKAAHAFEKSHDLFGKRPAGNRPAMANVEVGNG